MRPFVTIRKFLPSLKDPLDVNEITGIIYQVPCHDCPFVYIGQTKRDLKSRLSENKRAIKYQRLEKSALCEHTITLDHIIDRSEATILSTNKTTPNCKFHLPFGHSAFLHLISASAAVCSFC